MVTTTELRKSFFGFLQVCNDIRRLFAGMRVFVRAFVFRKAGAFLFRCENSSAYLERSCLLHTSNIMKEF